MATRINCVLLLLALFGLTPIVCHAQTSPSAQKHNAQAQAHRDKGDKLEAANDYAGAMREYQAAYSLDKGKPAQKQDTGVDLRKIGNAAADVGQNDAALGHYRQALSIAQQVHDKPGEAGALGSLGNFYASLSQPKQALTYDRQALHLFQQMHDRKGQSKILNNLGSTEVKTGQYRSAIADLQQALVLNRQTKDKMVQAGALLNLGDAYAGLGQGDQGIRDLQQAFALFQTMNSIDGQAKALADLGSAYRTLNQSHTAAEFYRKALPLLQQAKDAPEQATVLNFLGMADTDLNRYADAVSNCQQALSLFQQVNDRNGQAAALSNLAVAYQGLRQDDTAIQICGQASTLFQQLKDQDGQARIWLTQGLAYDDLSQYDMALSCFQRALPVFQQGHDRQGQANALLDLGIIYTERDAYDTAISYDQQALSLYQQVKDQNGEATALGNLSAVYAKLSRYDTAIDYCQQALPLFRKTENQEGEANTLSGLGLDYSYLGQYDAGIKDCQQALTLYQQISDQDGQANALNNLGAISNILSQYQNASQSCQQALALFQQAQDLRGQANTISNLGASSEGLHQNDMALDEYQQALALFQKIQDRDGQLKTYDDLGNLCSDLNQFDKAIEYYRQSLIFSQQIQDQDSVASALGNLGYAFLNLRQFDTALDYLQQSLVINTEIKDRAGIALDFSNLMLVWSARANPRLAIFYGKQSINVYQSIRQDIQSMDTQTQKGYLKDKEPTYRELAELLIQQGRLPEAEQVLGLLKDEELKDFVQRDATQLPPTQRTLPYDPAEEAKKEAYATFGDAVTAIGTQIEEIKRKQPITLAEAKQLTQLQDQLQPAQAKFQAFLTDLPKELPTATKDEPDPGQMLLNKSLQGPFQKTLFDLGPGTVAIYTIVEPAQVRIVLVTSQTQIARAYPITRDDLRHKVEDFRKALQEPDVDPRPYAQALDTILIGPIEKDLAGAKATTLMWSLDDDLRYIPIDALYDGKQYLIERYPSTEFTGASLSGLESAPPAHYTVLGLGVSDAHPGYAALPGVPQELNGIVKEGSGSAGVMDGTILLDGQFTWDALKTDLNLGYPVVHIASHFDLGADYAHSFLLLGDGPHSLDELSTQSQIFQSADLLTLSACETGVGGMDGDGHEIESFGSLAQEKGAQSIIASLWPVADSSTPLLMDDFYRQLAQGHISKAEALRQAQLSLLHGTRTPLENGVQRAKIIPDKKNAPSSTALPFMPDPKAPFAHPYYWAPFILIGNWK